MNNFLAGETEVLGENLPRRHLVHPIFHLPDPGANAGRRGGKPATNRLSYGAAVRWHIGLFDTEVDSISAFVSSYVKSKNLVIPND
jgi:hypothetical protein